MKWIAILGIIVLIGLSACGSSEATDDTKNGLDLANLTGWNIVVADDAIPSEIYAAEEFQEFFRQASGLKLPIVHKITALHKHVFIGPGKVMQASPIGFSVEDLGPEDLHIVVRDDNIAIAGGRPRGTLYGVYTFLEDYLGVRFLTKDHTHVPAMGNERTIDPVDRVYRPPFANLRLNGYEPCYRSPVFGVRTRNNGYHDQPRFGGISPFGNINHSFYRQLHGTAKDIREFAKAHPEYYCMVDGKRIADPGDNLQGNNPCYANPDVLRIVTESVLKEIELPSSVGRRNVFVSQNDGGNHCQCEKCAAIDKRAGSQMGSLLNFVNKVADELAKMHPDAFVGTLSYLYSRKPPKNIRPRDNVQINLCSIEACQLHALADPSCPRNVAYMQDLRGWSTICKHLYAWTYNINFHDYLLPYPNLYTIKPNINTLLDHGVEGVFMQCAVDGELADLRSYLISRLLWNPKLDDRELIDEFLHLHYGNAAPPIRRFINMTHKYYKDAGIHNSSCIFGHWDLPVDDAVATAGLKLFVEAMHLAQNDQVKARVEKASICAYRAAIEPIWRLKKHFAVDPVLPGQMRPLVKEFFRLCDKYGLGRYVAEDRQRIEGILDRQGAQLTLKLPLLPISRGWRFTTDPEKQGQAKQYFKTGFDDSHWTVLKEYDFWLGHYIGVAWYRQTINPPADIADKKHLYLFFGSVDEEAFVYINGKYAFERSVKSTSQGPEVLWKQPFLHDVKGLIRPGEPNIIAVKVYNSVLAGGIWLPVYLFPTDEEWTAQEISDSL